MTQTEEILLNEMRYIAGISTGQAKRVAKAALPDGWALVPIEPTEEMIVALMCTGLRHAEYRHGCDPTIAHMAQGYTAMLAAAQGAMLVTQQVAVPARGPLSDSEINAIWSEPLDRSKLSPFGMSRIRAILAAANDIGDKS